MFDTHAHIHDAAFDDDRDAMLERARAAGVEHILAVGTDLADSRRAAAVARHYGLQHSIGIHPHEAKDAPADLGRAFDDLVAENGARPQAIGECGLDYFYDHSPRERQREVLVAQLAYARAHDLPLIFHQRDAFTDFTATLREYWQPGARGVVHCFTGDTAQAQAFTGEFGLLLGIGGVLTFKNAAGLREAVAAVGLERLILETDCPYLAPVPHRGRRNEPAFVAEVARVLAATLDCPVADVERVTTANAGALFANAHTSGAV